MIESKYRKTLKKTHNAKIRKKEGERERKKEEIRRLNRLSWPNKI